MALKVKLYILVRTKEDFLCPIKGVVYVGCIGIEHSNNISPHLPIQSDSYDYTEEVEVLVR